VSSLTKNGWRNQGGLSSGYIKFIAENGSDDDSYSEEGLALFQVQGSGPENMQAIQVEPVASSLNSSYCYILHDGNIVFTWACNLTTTLDQELMERQLDVIKEPEPNQDIKASCWKLACQPGVQRLSASHPILIFLVLITSV